MSAKKQLGIKIRQARKKKRLTQIELAEQAGFSLQHLGDIERGTANPTLSCLQKISEIMDMTVADLFALPDEDAEPDEKEMREHLLRFIGKAGKKYLAVFYMLYRGIR